MLIWSHLPPGLRRRALQRWRAHGKPAARLFSSSSASTDLAPLGEPDVDISLSEITAAAYRIKDAVVQTTCAESLRLSELFGAHVYTKAEYQQRTGSFKERGAANVIAQLTDEQRRRGVVAASAGNHALALAYHGPKSQVPVSVVMPTVAPLTKVTNCRAFGARVFQEGHHLLESREVAARDPRFSDMLYVNGYDDPGIIAGQGTIGLEMMHQVPNLDAVIVPVGGGGLIAGVALAVKALNPRCEVIGIEPRRCASWTAALEAGHPVPVDSSKATLADGLAVTTVGENAFRLGRDLVDEVLMVGEGSIALAVLRLLELERTVVEGGGATAIAGFLEHGGDGGALARLRGKRVGAILCGGNIDMPVLGKVIERGLAADGRIHRFVARVSDRPGGIAHLTGLIADTGASVKDLYHERAGLADDFAMVSITVWMETRDAKHAEEVARVLEEEGISLSGLE